MTDVKNGTEQLTFDLDPKNACALAQFVKKLTWSEMRSCAVDDGEADEIRDAINELKNALAKAGYKPR